MLMKRILVCGGRNYNNVGQAWRVLAKYVGHDDIVIEGGANGADSLANQFCREHGIAVAVVPANWGFYDKRAGALRNSWMLRLNPDLVIAFPGGSGTANMIAQAKAAKVEVIIGDANA
jgi:predicted Rossmann-fold nucleotide-binding protein